jgi:hypothetical protein
LVTRYKCELQHAGSPRHKKGTFMHTKGIKRSLKVTALAAALVAVLLMPTGCATTGAATGGGAGGITLGL